MPFIPLIAAGVTAAGSAISSENARVAAEKQSKDAAAAAETARQTAAANAAQAIKSQQQEATSQSQQKQQSFADAVLTPQLQQNQNSLTGQLQDAAAGKGPNPAQAMLAQSTGANVANQAALMAGQRGAGANVGLIARQAAQQGAATQQQAAGQGATLDAQQQIAARGQLQQQLAGQQAAGLQAQQGAAQTALGNQGITTSALTNAGQQGTQLAGQAMGIQGAAGQQANQYQHQAVTGALGGLGSALQTGLGSTGGATPTAQYSNPQISSYAAGGDVQKSSPKSAAGKFMSTLFMAHGGAVPAMVSPGERYLSPKEVEKVAKGKKEPMKAGERIPGKAKVDGAKNSYRNDTVAKTLETGGIVLPRSVTQAKNPAKEAAKFVNAILAKKKGLRK